MVRDRITRFTGIAVAKVEYLSGNKQIGIQPRVGSDGKYPDVAYVDSKDVELVSEGIHEPPSDIERPVDQPVTLSD